MPIFARLQPARPPDLKEQLQACGGAAPRLTFAPVAHEDPPASEE